MKLSITRIETLSIAHRLNSPRLSREENVKLFGKCNNPNGHGHNYKLEVSIEGPVDPITGMIINMTDLKDIIKVAVLDVFDHTNLDFDHSNHFSFIPSTTENFLLVISNELRMEFEKRFPIDSKVKLSKIVLWETDKNHFTIEL